MIYRHIVIIAKLCYALTSLTNHGIEKHKGPFHYKMCTVHTPNVMIRESGLTFIVLELELG